ncbi:hypothetical protein M0805_004750 [Coniferiporia weirii]|nr:hypothetical protein M0805_004750 [Coniferiporia weirii]
MTGAHHLPISFRHPTISTDFTILVQKTRRLHRNEVFASLDVTLKDIIGKENFQISDEEDNVLVTLTCIPVLLIDDYVALLMNGAAGQVGNMKTVLESLGKASDVLTFLMKFTELASDVHPAVNAAVILVNALYERCVSQKKCHEAAVKLMHELASFLPFIMDIKLDIAKNSETRRTVKQMLELFCDVSRFIIKYSSKGMLGDLLSSSRGEVDSSMEKFTRLKDSLGWCIQIEMWRSAMNTEKNTESILLQQLCPAMEAYYSEDQRCLEGTRVAILGEIRAWADSESESRLFWLHGVAGSGKSYIASSVAHMLRQQRRLLGCFFFKRDDPDRRIPHKVIPTLAYHFSKWHADYRSQMILLLQGEEGLDIYSSLTRQLDLLVKKSLAPLSFGPETCPPMPVIIVIDALDECEEMRDRFQLAQTLLHLINAVPWLKIFITGRPHEDFRRMFSKCQSPDIDAKIEFDLQGADIMQYTKFCARMPKEINLTDSEIEALAKMASGLFIWTSTAFRFIGGQSDLDGAVSKILSLEMVDTQEVGLDQLYTTIIKSVVDSEGAEGVHIISVILGVILSTSRNKPLPEDVLLHFLSAAEQSIDQEKLRVIVDSLQAVIYRDASNKGAICVHHPSFLDFISNNSCSKLYWTESEGLELIMARKCLEIMLSQLKFNICDLQSSLIANDRVPGIQDTISMLRSLYRGAVQVTDTS